MGLAGGDAAAGVTGWAPWTSRYAVPRSGPAAWERRSSPRCRRWRRATGAVNLGQGFPDTDGPVEVLDAAVPRCAPVSTSTHPVRGIPELREACAPPGAVLRARVRPGDRGAGHRRGDGGDRGRPAGPVEPGDEVVVLEPYYDSYAAIHRVRRRRPRAGDAATAATSRSTSTSSRGRHPPHPADPAQHPAQPDRRGVARGRAQRDRRDRRRARPRGRRGRGLRAHDVRGARTSRWPPCRGCGSARVTIGQAGKTFSMTGWKIGWVTADRRSWWRQCARSSSS